MARGEARFDTRESSVFAGAGERLRAAARLKTTVWLVGTVAALAVAFTLRETQMVTMPFAFAFFIAVALAPVSERVAGHMPRRLRWLGPACAMIVVLIVFGIFLGGIWIAAERVSERLPSYADQAGEWWSALTSGGTGESASASADGSSGSAENGAVAEALASRVCESNAENILHGVAGYADTILSSAASIGLGLVSVFFFTLLMLLESATWRAKLSTLTSDHDDVGWSRAVTVIGQRFRWYLVTRTILGAITGVLYGLWTWAFGLEFALVWGLLGFLLNCVPTLGSIVAGTLPVAFALFTKDVGTALIVAAGLLVIEQVMGNFVDPKMQGRQLALSPLVVLFSLLVWAWIWGIPGALLAVPLTVLVTIVCAHVRPLRRIALVLSDERDYAGLDDHTRPS